MAKVKEKIRSTYIDLEKEIVPVGFDLVFKKLFGICDSNKYIRHLLKKILKISPKKIKILNNEFIGDSYNKKNIVVDFIMGIDNGDKIGIELNSIVSTYLKERNLLYMFRISGQDLDSGEDYSKLHNHIQINFDFKGHHFNPIEEGKIVDIKSNKIMFDSLTIIRIDVPYFVKRCYNEDAEKLDSLTKFIGLMAIKTRKVLDKIVKGDAIMEEIYEKAKEFSKDEQIVGAYNLEEHRRKLMISEKKEGYREGIKKGKIEGKKEGRIEGIKEGKIEGIKSTVKNMLKEKLDINLISKVTGLSINEINGLRQ